MRHLQSNMNCLASFSVFGGSKRKAETEMKRAKVFPWRAIRIPSVIEPSRTDRQFVAQAPAERVTDVVDAGLLGSRKQVARIKEQCALELAVNRKRVFNIEDGVEFATDRISLRIVRSKIAFAETADAGGAAVKKALVNRERSRLVRTGMIQRMHNADPRAESER